MRKPKFESLMRHRMFREWWSKELQDRPNKLYDYNTGKPMALQKRLFKERPKVDDLLRFLIDCKVDDINIHYLKDSNKFSCELFHIQWELRILRFGLTASSVVSDAVLQFLKARTKKPNV